MRQSTTTAFLGLLFCLTLYCDRVALPVPAEEPVVTKTIVTISNMHCEGCAKRIRARLFTLPNVSKVTTTLSKNEAVIEPSQGKAVSAYAVWDALEKGEFTEKPPSPAKDAA
jgi:copper chaperone CopZ